MCIAVVRRYLGCIDAGGTLHEARWMLPCANPPTAMVQRASDDDDDGGGGPARTYCQRSADRRVETYRGNCPDCSLDPPVACLFQRPLHSQERVLEASVSAPLEGRGPQQAAGEGAEGLERQQQRQRQRARKTEAAYASAVASYSNTLMRLYLSFLTSFFYGTGGTAPEDTAERIATAWAESVCRQSVAHKAGEPCTCQAEHFPWLQNGAVDRRRVMASYVLCSNLMRFERYVEDGRLNNDTEPQKRLDKIAADVRPRALATLETQADLVTGTERGMRKPFFVRPYDPMEISFRQAFLRKRLVELESRHKVAWVPHSPYSVAWVVARHAIDVLVLDTGLTMARAADILTRFTDLFRNVQHPPPPPPQQQQQQQQEQQQQHGRSARTVDVGSGAPVVQRLADVLNRQAYRLYEALCVHGDGEAGLSIELLLDTERPGGAAWDQQAVDLTTTGITLATMWSDYLGARVMRLRDFCNKVEVVADAETMRELQAARGYGLERPIRERSLVTLPVRVANGTATVRLRGALQAELDKHLPRNGQPVVTGPEPLDCIVAQLPGRYTPERAAGDPDRKPFTPDYLPEPATRSPLLQKVADGLVEYWKSRVIHFDRKPRDASSHQSGLAERRARIMSR